MDVKKEPFDPPEEVIKTEQDLVYSETVDKDLGSIKLQTIKSEVDDLSNIFEFQSTSKLENVDEIKQEIIECEVPKIEQRSDLLKIEHVKTELDREVKTTDFVSNKSDIKHEFVDHKTVSELLTSHCDLPTLKSNDEDYPDYYVVPGSSKQDEGVLKTENNTANTVAKKRRYPCPVCQKCLPSSESRSKHVNGHFGKRSATCKFCGKLMHEIDLFQHYFIHVVKNRTRKVPQSINDVSNIETALQNKTSFKCEICSKEFVQQDTLQRHLTVHLNKQSFKCDVCLKFFSTEWRLKQHSKIHSNENLFKIQPHLTIHINKKSFKCDICLKEFDEKCNLEKHLTIHTIEKPFPCYFCPKQFLEKFILQRHLLTHTNEKSFECEICSKKFAQKTTLQQHISMVHINDRPFKCGICSKAFNKKSSVNVHLKIHTKEKPFQCDICLNKFDSNTTLRRHLVRHTNERPFECNICSHKCKRKKDLQRHLKIH